MDQQHCRRSFLASSTRAASAAWLVTGPCHAFAAAAEPARSPDSSRMRFGLVTYMWGAQWDLPTLIGNCQRTGVLGVELRTTHRHGVEPNLTKRQRDEVRMRFDESPVELVGLGSDERLDHTDPGALKNALAAAKSFVVLSRDIGGSGVKVKPNDFHKDVPKEKTIEQIGRSLNQLGRFAEDHGQQIRLEVHGSCSRLPDIKAIMDVADHENVAICWNSNSADLEDKGLDYNFNLVKDRFGATCHVRPLDSQDYPYKQLLDLLVGIDYHGWVMLEDGRVPPDAVAELLRQRQLFERMVSDAQPRNRQAPTLRPG